MRLYNPDMSDERNPAEAVRLRPIEPGDIDALYAFQLDPAANAMAAVHPRDEVAFREVWSRILDDPNASVRAIIADGELAGQITVFNLKGQDAVGYWIAREHWGRGIATRAIGLMLDEVTTRPLYARVATHNAASIRVLEKCGFVVTGYAHSPGDERYVACEEALLELT